ncbi:MAG: RagB/SusD family nutrient uptake outer membrane protein [Prevotellaceae bacterium]|nr:RagB/SusD family nutrient uptake outer membrane protein [Candidatus Minthosoma caballi]MBQ0104077.1 RagB/SusD family nutrient uptake outer membrane protein [Candidatus Colivivens caballi]
MKNIIKKICLFGLSALMLVSCEDMFTADNELVTTDLTPQDTLYQVMGIVKRMQKIATSTVLLGEARADLVDINKHTPSDIRELAENNVSETNAYNNPADYYAVINNCNIYLAYVDSLLKTHGEYYYEKEIMAVKTFRAWTYLELAKIYGQVPLITKPIESSDVAEELVKQTKVGLDVICDTLIKDLEGYAYMNLNDELLPSYNAKFHDQSYSNFFIPARVMLAELYLWRGSKTGSKSDFINAVRMYHDYFTFSNEERPTGTNDVSFTNVKFTTIVSAYASNFSYGEQVTVIPMDTIGFYGNTTDLRSVFCSAYKNDYYAQLNPSKFIKELSQSQKHCYYRYLDGVADTLYAPTDTIKNPFGALAIGDLRLYSIYDVSVVKDIYHSNYSEQRQYIDKYEVVDGRDDVRLYFVPLFRVPVLYLHMAEALNHAGFPETAFVVLKYGISNKNLNKYVGEDELEGLSKILTYGLPSTATQTTFLYWGSDPDLFLTRDLNSATGSSSYDMIGIHSLGSGHSEYNAYYELPRTSAAWAEYDAVKDTIAVLTDSLVKIVAAMPDSETDPEAYSNWFNNEYAPVADHQSVFESQLPALCAAAKASDNYEQFVADKILDEEALEGMFEGHRFYDLMRYAMYYNKPDFIAEQVAKRRGATETYAPADNLRGGNWYIPLRSR